MSQAILITAYKDFSQLDRMISRFRDFYVYVHIDRKAIGEAKSFLMGGGKYFIDKYIDNGRVKIVSKYTVGWGGYNHLLSVIYLMKLANKNPDVSYIHIVSGQDYPVKGKAEFDVLEQSGNIFMTCTPLDSTSAMVKERYRYTHLFARLWDIRSTRYIKWDKRSRKYLPLERKRIGKFRMPDIYKGMVWVSMPKNVSTFVCDFIRTVNGLRFMFGLLWSEIPEEIFFQTILMHSVYRGNIVNDNMRYTLWHEKNGALPGILDESDFESIINSNAIFARKISSDCSAKLLNMLDEMI